MLRARYRRAQVRRPGRDGPPFHRNFGVPASAPKPMGVHARKAFAAVVRGRHHFLFYSVYYGVVVAQHATRTAAAIV